MTTSTNNACRGELLPCPFCGGRAQYFSRTPEIGNVSQKGNIWWVSCGAACEQSVEAGHADKEDAAKAWNTRHQAAHDAGVGGDVLVVDDKEIHKQAAENALRAYVSGEHNCRYKEALDTAHEVFGAECDQMQARLRTAPASRVNEWQPIKTAPKKHGQLILLMEGDKWGGIYAGDWMPEYQGWRVFCGQPVIHTPEPTHWMPLPEPPQARAAIKAASLNEEG